MISLNYGNIPYLSLPAAHGGGTATDGEWIGVLDQLLENITQRVGGAGDQPSTGSALEWLPGLHTLADNPHPLLVHFPIAFLFAFFVLECYAVATRKTKLQQLSSLLLYLSAISAVITAAAGLYAAKTVPHALEVHEIMQWHGYLGLSVASLAIALSLWRMNWKLSAPQTAMSRSFSLILATLMVIALFFGADLGGYMVYRFGVGVKAVQQAENHLHEQQRDPQLPGR
jgi:uncharacterized membrane protein